MKLLIFVLISVLIYGLSTAAVVDSTKNRDSSNYCCAIEHEKVVTYQKSRIVTFNEIMETKQIVGWEGCGVWATTKSMSKRWVNHLIDVLNDISQGLKDKNKEPKDDKDPQPVTDSPINCINKPIYQTIT
jgi:hypothetical protein